MENRSVPAVEAVLDATTLQGLRDLMGDQFHALAHTFIADSDLLLSQMTEAYQSHDLAALRRASHTMKSTSASFGATHLSSLARTLEHAAMQATPTLDPGTIDQLAVELERVRKALESC